MVDGRRRLDLPSRGAIAWLDVSAENPDTWSGRLRTGPLGLQIAPLRHARAPYFFKGARLRGTRCIWSASTLSGADLYRASRPAVAPPFDNGVHILARMDAGGSVFDPVGTSTGTMRVFDPADEIAEQFLANTHLFTLNIPLAAIGLDPSLVAGMREHPYELTPFQSQLLRSAVGLLLAGGDELVSASSLVGVDRYLAALAALLLRTAVAREAPDLAAVEQVRQRTDAIIYEQATDANLTPATIAAQLNISLRQLYRAFNGLESPAARIRRRRLERAAEILASRGGPGHVERVAAECGFSSAEYFSRAFRREFGLSPRAYRSTHRDVTSR
ncbi:helix-turn-helix domain-containing protein [Jatrophihabitans endophyticus]|uniref:helix-turn-helix domain-containing protein n=1 Tax=Jatrophihabitans endophyticus TaxID=1206085 RepID=UPI0019ED9737|nr:AraC family transcriptional regulator [Jatrophihabitans endophyticus]MBE7188967.1 helix-turn-helix transcriptional regulator [Jatrophihabitans endophyticus]